MDIMEISVLFWTTLSSLFPKKAAAESGCWWAKHWVTIPGKHGCSGAMTDATEKQISCSVSFQAQRPSTESLENSPTPSLLWTREFQHRIIEGASRSIYLPTGNGSHSAALWAFIRRYKGQEDRSAGCNHLIYTSCSFLLRLEPWNFDRGAKLERFLYYNQKLDFWCL